MRTRISAEINPVAWRAPVAAAAACLLVAGEVPPGSVPSRPSTPTARADVVAAAAANRPGAAAGAGSADTAKGDGVDRWEIDVTQPSREVIFTNTLATHFATDTSAREMRSYAGLYTSMHEALDDYVLQIDGDPLEPARATRARVWPWLLRREFQSGTAEEVLLPLDEPALLVRLVAPESAAPQTFSVTPRLDMRWIWDTPRPDYEQVSAGGILCFRRSGWTPGPGALAWLAVHVSVPVDFHAAPRRLDVRHPRDAARRAMEMTHPYEPGAFVGSWPRKARAVDIVFAQGATAAEAAARARRLLPQRDVLLQQRQAHVERLLARASLETGDARLDKSYRWVRASMDELLMRARGEGIYAGFHWFPNYWGRDTFISLLGATIDTGQLDEARAILRSFLEYQNVDRDDPREGRLPNIVQPDQLQYAGVDGTWWYVRAAFRYVLARRSSGTPDSPYERELAGALRLMIDGAERKAVDSSGLLTHGDAETWMDAGGEAHPYTPRGNRAVEVQALYYNGLRVAEWLAREHGDAPARERYGRLADRTRTAFHGLLWDPKARRLADHLNTDGSRDAQIRPNVILALTAVERDWPPLLSADEEADVVELVMQRLVRPYGVVSLDPADPAFRPRHLDLDAYFFDEAYHNGDVWYWLSGPMITALCRQGRAQEARQLLEPLVAQALDHGAVGAIQEIRDGGDSGENDEFGGAVFQAWSMAEMIRAMHEDLAGPLGWTERP